MRRAEYDRMCAGVESMRMLAKRRGLTEEEEKERDGYRAGIEKVNGARLAAFRRRVRDCVIAVGSLSDFNRRRALMDELLDVKRRQVMPCAVKHANPKFRAWG